jgi:6,7-dimethyl-8-ribityllumazine synthase
MAGHGSPTSTLKVDGRGINVVIVAGTWHDEISNGLVAGAERALTAAGASFSLVRVAGSFELPLACQIALENGADAAVALGVIIRGGTPHFEYVSQAVTDGILQLNLSLPVPVIFGLLTLDTEVQAHERLGGIHGHKGEEAALTALKMIQTGRKLRG